MSQPDTPEKKPTLFTRMFGAARYIMTVAVVAIFLGASVLLLVAVFEMGLAIWYEVFSGSRANAEAITLSLRVAVIDAVDTMLVATVLFIIAFGLYQLFVDPSLRSQLPRWLRVSGIDDLETRLAGMAIVVLGVIFLTQALESHGQGDLLGFGLAVAAVIAALSLFLYQEGKRHNPHLEDED
jgi:uncharacterized membrane protein YqhA